MKKVLPFLFTLLFIIFVSQLETPVVYSHHKGVVLGEATTASELQFPKISSGPGLILPDSPLYFLDDIFQSIKLATAFSGEDKAKVRAQIAGERLAELRIMLSRNNTKGIETALSKLTKEVDLSSKTLSDVSANGADVSKTAKDVNDTLNTHREVLKQLEDQATGSLKLELQAARQSMKEAKVAIEDELSDDDLANEIENALNEELEDTLNDSQKNTESFERKLEELEKGASKSAERSMQKREELLKKAIETKNDTLRKHEEQGIVDEKTRQEMLFNAKKESLNEARKSLKDSGVAAQKYKEARKRILELKKDPSKGLETVGQTPSEVNQTFDGAPNELKQENITNSPDEK